MRRALCIAVLLPLCGCGIAPAVIISAVGLGVTVVKDVVGIDVSLQQNDPTKTPINTVVAPIVNPTVTP